MHLRFGFSKIIVLLLCSHFTLFSSAQDIPLMPESISVQDLEEISYQLELSSIQTSRLLDRHEVYSSAWRDVMNNEVNDLMNHVISVGESMGSGMMNFQIPERKEFEKVYRLGRAAFDAMAKTNRSFLEVISPGLTQEQLLGLEAVAMYREDAVYQAITQRMLGSINDGGRTNLAEIVNEVFGGTEYKSDIAFNLVNYLKRRIEIGKRSMTDIEKSLSRALDGIEELGLREMQMMEMFQRMQDEKFTNDLGIVFDEVTRPLQERADDLSKLNLEYWVKLSKLMDSDDRYEVGRRFFSKSYWELFKNKEGSLGSYEFADKLERTIDVAEAQGDEELFAELLAFQESYRKGLLERALKGAREIAEGRKFRSFSDSGGMRGFFGGGRGGRGGRGGGSKGSAEAPLTEEAIARQERNQRNNDWRLQNERTLDQYAQRLPEEALEDNEGTFNGEKANASSKVVEKNGVKYSQNSKGEWEAVGGKAEGKKSESGQGGFAQMDLQVSSPISPSERDAYGRVLGVQEEQRIVLDVLYDQYRGDYSSWSDSLIEEFKVEDEELKKAEDEGSRWRGWWQRRRSRTERAQNELGDLEKGFFQSLGELVDGARSELLGLLESSRRRRVKLGQNSWSTRWSRGGNRSNVDLVSILLLEEPAPPAELESSLIPALLVYSDEADRLANNIIETGEKSRRMMQGGREMRRSSREGNDGGAYETYQKKMLESLADARLAGAEMTTHNNDSLNEMLAAAPTNYKDEVLRRFRKAVYSDQLKGSGNIDELFVVASSIQGISVAQKNSIGEMRIEYLRKSDLLAEKLIDLEKEADTNAVKESSQLSWWSPAQARRGLKEGIVESELEELDDRFKFKLQILLGESLASNVPNLLFPNQIRRIKADPNL